MALQLGTEGARTTGNPFRVLATAPLLGRWDRVRVEQIVANLLFNAMKFGRGGPIEVSVVEEDGLARLRVQDEGIGIAADRLPRIFDRFERAVSAREYGGLGLGLYIVRSIVEALGGRVSVESALGVGSTFTVELPLAGPPRGKAPGLASNG